MAVIQGFANTLVAWKGVAAATNPISRILAIANAIQVTTKSVALIAKISASQYKSRLRVWYISTQRQTHLATIVGKAIFNLRPTTCNAHNTTFLRHRHRSLCQFRF